MSGYLVKIEAFVPADLSDQEKANQVRAMTHATARDIDTLGGSGKVSITPHAALAMEAKTSADEAVMKAARDSLTPNAVLMPSVIAAFHRALRERGYVVVPVEPTKEMIEAGYGAMPKGPFFQFVKLVYRAMLGAVK